ncbi:two-component sensor histidine kinase [Paenibacillus agaridevorans]|jgi:two-component system sensor histidine kinase YesM|uniref:histidine kinase n=1 Tax=Paenibacillus agaridevorans TaxID=171404 RepID=A0A2R5F5B3_9BACL|nr:sensor histidine kinase [Paenibacillus agaridevorans]GBG11444.1 two-component sensor histidine kinase [Paenibacillus agaridevorans]
MNLRPKLMLAFITLIIIPMIVLGIFSFLNSETLLEKKYSEQSEITMKAIGGNLSYFFRELNQLSNGNVISSVVQDILKQNDLSMDDPSTIIRINQDEKQISSILFQHPAVSYVVLYSSDGTMYRSNRNDPTTFRPITFEQLRQHSLYDDVIRLGGIPLWIGPHEQKELTGVDPPLFTMLRVVKDIQSFNDIGIMVTQYKTEDVSSMLKGFQNPDPDSQGSRYFIMNGKGLIMLDSNKEYDGGSIDLYTNSMPQLTQEYKSARMKFDGVDSLVSSYKLGLNDWVLLSVQPWNTLTDENIRFVQWIGMITVLGLLSAVLFNVFFVNRVAKSIIKVVRKMRLVEQGLLDIRVTAQGKDETVLLANSFNSMVERIGNLLSEVRREQDRKQHAEMMLMQAQIKPHFLFNTLESINALAAQNEGAKIMLMVRRLSNLLRTSMHHSEEIGIKQEIEHVRSYLEIQKYRFEELFSYELQVPEEALQYSILKLTLQPLVENSIQHGFDGYEDGQGVISIDVSVEPHSLVIMVSDNGKGMSQEVLQKLAEGYSPSRKSQDEAELGERRGLGIRNVADRLRIHYGPGYGMMICSTEGEGTTIRCIIPKSRGESA